MPAQLPISSIKEEVKKKHLSNRWCFSSFQPTEMSMVCSDRPRHVARLPGIVAQRLGIPLAAVFIACSRRSRTVPKPTKPNRGQVGDHSSIGDFSPIAVSGYPRGPRVGCETTCPRHTLRLTNRLRLALEPSVPRTRRPPPKNSPARGVFDPRHSSCLSFQMLGVEAHSSLPHDQNNGGNLPG